MAGGTQKSGARTLTWGTIPSNVPSLLRDLPILLAALAFFYAIALHDALLDDAGRRADGNSSGAERAAAIRDVFRAANRGRIHGESGVHAGIWIRRGVQRARRKDHGATAGYAAVHPRAQFSSRCDGGDGGAFSYEAARRGAGLHTADFHRASVEHDVQFLLIAEKYSARDARSRRNLPLELVATVHADGAALFDHRAGVEFDDVRGRRLVFPDGLRNVHAGRSRFAPARIGLLSADRRERGKHACDLVGHGSDDRNHSGD